MLFVGGKVWRARQRGTSVDYLDFVLEILEGQGRDHVVAVQRAPTGVTPRVKMRFPFTPAKLENNLLALENAILRSATTRRSGGLREQTIEDAIRAQKPERPPPTQQPAKKSTGKKDQPKR